MESKGIRIASIVANQLTSEYKKLPPQDAGKLLDHIVLWSFAQHNNKSLSEIFKVGMAEASTILEKYTLDTSNIKMCDEKTKLAHFITEYQCGLFLPDIYARVDVFIKGLAKDKESYFLILCGCKSTSKRYLPEEKIEENNYVTDINNIYRRNRKPTKQHCLVREALTQMNKKISLIIRLHVELPQSENQPELCTIKDKQFKCGINLYQYQEVTINVNSSRLETIGLFDDLTAQQLKAFFNADA